MVETAHNVRSVNVIEISLLKESKVLAMYCEET